MAVSLYTNSSDSLQEVLQVEYAMQGMPVHLEGREGWGKEGREGRRGRGAGGRGREGRGHGGKD